MKLAIGIVVGSLIVIGIALLSLSGGEEGSANSTLLKTASKSLEVGSEPPNFTVKTVNGKKVELAALKGKPVVLESYAYWCPSCLIEGKNLTEAVAPYKDKVEIVAFTFDPNERKDGTEDFKKQTGAFWDFVLLDDGKEIVLAYELTGPDITYIIGKDGKIVYKDKGLTDPQTFKTEIEKVL